MAARPIRHRRRSRQASSRSRPSCSRRWRPEYPPAALAAGKTAKVKVRIHIDATGMVTAVDVVDKVGDGFDEAAVAAAMQYVFEPAEIDGKPAPIAVETTINFVIEHGARARATAAAAAADRRAGRAAEPRRQRDCCR